MGKWKLQRLENYYNYFTYINLNSIAVAKIILKQNLNTLLYTISKKLLTARYFCGSNKKCKVLQRLRGPDCNRALCVCYLGDVTKGVLLGYDFSSL